MTEQTLHPTPSWSVVAKEEFGALGIGLRREMQLFAAALIVFAALILIGWARNAGGGARAGFVPGYGIVAPILLIGLFAPLAIWKGDTPAQRGYFWSMPVDRTPHEWLKMALGWAWMVGFLVVYVLWMLALTWVTGGHIHGVRTGFVQSGGESRWITEPLPAWILLVPLTAFAIVYLVGSAVAVGSNYPWRWFVGVPVAYAVLLALFGAAGLRGAQEVLESVLSGRFGLGAALTGTTSRAFPAVLKNGNEVMLHSSVPDLSAWLVATLIWLGLALVVFAIVARHHQEG